MKAKQVFRIILLIMVVYVNSFAQNKLTGYWQGDFMSGSGLILELYFSEFDNSKYSGKVFLFQNKSLIQEDDLTNIKLLNENLWLR